MYSVEDFMESLKEIHSLLTLFITEKKKNQNGKSSSLEFGAGDTPGGS